MASSKKICGYCNKPIINDTVVMALGKCWHKDHFICNRCKKPLKDAKYIQEGGQAYCEADWKTLFQKPNLPKCAQCNLPIQDTVLSALGKSWHKDHFVCTHCKQPFKDSKFFVEDGKPYCEADHKALFQGTSSANAPICAQCNKPITGTVTSALGKTWHKEHFVCTHCKKPFNESHFLVEDGKPYCEADHKKLFQSSQAAGSNPICAHCNKPITDTVLTALGKSWHKEHFVCAHCKKPIEESSFNAKDGQPYCSKDFTTLFRKKCSGCGGTIQDTVLTALEKFWHKQCFTCAKCKQPIPVQQGFTENNGNPFCLPCSTT